MGNLTVTPQPTAVGEEVTLTLTGASPGTSVEVTVTDGGDPPEVDTIVIQTDNKGKGTAKWTIPPGFRIEVTFSSGVFQPVTVELT